MTQPLSIVIAEDNYLVREGTRQLLEATGAVQVVATVGSSPELIDASRRLCPDAVLTDIRMPPGHRMEGIAAAHAIRRESPDVGIVVLSQHADGSYAAELFRDGTAGLAYLLKERIGDHREIVRALQVTTSGGSVVDPVIVEALVAERRGAADSGLSRLSPRELEVLSQMAQGHTNRAIGIHLHLSDSAVEKHIRAVFTKLDLAEEGVHRRVAAVLAFLRSEPGLP